MRKITLTTMFIPIFCMAAMINPEFCIGQSNTASNDSKGQLSCDQLMLNDASFKHYLTTKDKPVTTATTMDLNQKRAKNIHIPSRELATPNEIKATSSGIRETKMMFLPKELASILLTSNKEVCDPNRANSGHSAELKDESNLFGAFFPGLLNEKIL